LSRLRAAVPSTNALVGVDLADRKQVVVAELVHGRAIHGDERESLSA
jgi:hypothetical protein